MGELLPRILVALNVLVLGYFVVLNVSYLAMSVLAFRALRRYGRRMKSIDVQEMLEWSEPPGISLIAPAFNEEQTCVASVRSLLTLEYADYEVVVVNDGSTDATLERLTEAFDFRPAARLPASEIPTEEVRGIYRSRRHPDLWLVDKENGGKADALNTGINYSRKPLFCAMDADSLLERDALLRIVRPFLEDDRTIAAGGILRIVNGCTVRHGQIQEIGLPDNLLARTQVLEYLRAFLTGRMGWDAVGATLVISGAFGAFRRSAVAAAGGYATDTVGEDMELVVRLHRYHREVEIPYRIHFVPDPVAWTECPEDLATLGRQRDRWQRGLYQSLTRHWTMMLRPRYGRPGMLAFPYFFFLELLGPAIEVGAYVVFALTLLAGLADPWYVAAFLAVAIVLGIALSLFAIVLEELSFRRYPRWQDLLRLGWIAVIENVGYRQLVSWWRIKGTVSALRGVETWGAMTRKGFGDEESAGGARS